MTSYRALLATAALGAANDNFFKTALVMWIAFRSVSLWGLDAKSLIALAGAIFILPYFLFSGLAGELSDSRERSQLIVGTKVFELVVMALASLCFHFSFYPGLLLLLFLMGAQSTFFSPAKYSSIMDLNPPEKFVGANAQMEAVSFAAILLGSIAGGIAAQWNQAWIISLVLMSLAVLGWLSSKQIQSLARISESATTSLSLWRSSKEILGKSLKNADVLFSIVAASWFWFLGAAMLSLIPVLAKESLAANESVATSFLACFTLGVGLGSLLCQRLSPRQIDLGISVLGLLGISIFLYDLGNVDFSVFTAPPQTLSLGQFIAYQGAARILLDLLLFSLSCGLFIVPLNAWMQWQARTYRSQVVAANNIVNALAMVLASLALMLLYALELSLPQIFQLFAISNLFLGAIFLLSYPKLLLSFFVFSFKKENSNYDHSQALQMLNETTFLLKINNRNELRAALRQYHNHYQTYYAISFIANNSLLMKILYRAGIRRYGESLEDGQSTSTATLLIYDQEEFATQFKSSLTPEAFAGN